MDCSRRPTFFYLTVPKTPLAVCQDFRVREDGVLASKLQEEEFQKHYFRNKSERKTVRGDVRVAKQTYLEEVKTAQLLPEHELEELSMEETDKWLARDLQEKLHDEERREIERQKRLALKDAKVAKSFQEREKEKFDREWRRKREEETLGREQQEQEQRRIEEEEIDEQKAREMRDARMARELQEREREEYERERERYRRERERHRYEREKRREREIERMDGNEVDRQKELEMRDARIARDLQEREKQKFDREWQRRREQEMLEEQERRHYQRSASDPNDSRRTTSRPQAEAINGHADPVIHRQKRSGSGRDERREKRKSTGSNSSGGSVGKEEKRPKEERRPLREEPSPRAERRSPRDERRPTRGERTQPREEQRPPRDERTTSREMRRPPKDERSPPSEERSYEHGEGAVVALPPAENGGRLEHDRIIMADGTAIHLFDDEEEKQKAIAEEKQKVLERERRKAHERERQKALEKEKQKALELEKVKKDEEYARMLQDQERRIVEAERTAAEDRRLAMEEQDRELARHLQRQEYQRMQQEKKERQMRRANSLPSDRHSVNLEDPRRLPSYEEALHRRQLPDLLPGNDPTTTRYALVSTTSSDGRGSSLERETNIQVEREKYAAQEHDRSLKQHLRSRGPEGSEHLVTAVDYSLSMREPEGFLKEERESRRDIDTEERCKPIEREYKNDEIEGKQSPKDQRYTRDATEIRNPPSEDRHPASEDRHPPSEDRYPASEDRHSSMEERHPPKDDDNRRSFPIITDFENPEHEDSDDEGQTNLDQAIWQTREPVSHSPQTSLERNKDDTEHKLSARSSYASSGGNSFDRRSVKSGTPPTREDVWERFDDDEEFYNATGRMSRQMFRSQTVASAYPTNHESERHMMYNVVEGIDPTFRRQRKDSEDDPKENSTEERAKVIQLIKPQRRRSTDKKKSKDRKK